MSKILQLLPRPSSNQRPVIKLLHSRHDRSDLPRIRGQSSDRRLFDDLPAFNRNALNRTSDVLSESGSLSAALEPHVGELSPTRHSSPTR
jgi:hypothetical protein